MEADKMLDIYIHDYLVKRKLGASARTFKAEAQVVTNRTAIDAPAGFLLEWWSVFWDVFIVRFKSPVSSTTGSYNAVQMMKTLEQQQQQKGVLQKQQQGDDTQLLRGTTNEVITKQSPGTTNALTKRVYENYPPAQRNPLSEANKTPANTRSSGSFGQHLDANHSVISNLDTYGDQHSGQIQHSVPGGNLSFFPPLIDQDQQLRVPQLDQSLTNMMNPSLNFKAAESGADHGVNSLLLKGWPFMGLEQLQSGLIQQQSSTTHLSHPSQQLQQQVHMLLSDQYMDMNQGDLSNFGGNIVLDRDLPVQVGLPLFSLTDSAMLKNTNQSQEQGQRSALLGKHPENPSSSIQQQDKSVASGSTTMEVSLLNTSGGDDQADVVPLINHGSVDSSVEFFLSDNADTESTISRCLGTNIALLEIGTFRSGTVNCCDLSSDGKLIANGEDKKVVLWCTDSQEQKYILEEHSDAITDVRFGPRLPRLASSSLDKTIKIWDVHNPGHSIRCFTGHSASVMSLDFHPTKEDLICSCDNVSTIRYWNIKNGGCAGVSKVGATVVRFQPNRGKYLAAAVANGVSLIDVETTQTCRYPLKGHISKIQAICWSSSGEYLASLSEDMVQVWKIGSSGEQQCMHERSVKGKKFRCCTFHPCYPSVLVLGSYQCLELWHMADNKMMILLEEPVNSLAASRSTGLVASAGVNNLIRLWK
ncbi:transcriptional corepressor LEUNIG-like isoform X5 [Nicotiana tabacum]|uniref:Transcriptional corepressor LEUNIG-like isoform X1 n=1 Tax=Nicotiana tabacum TaxID=4097 RepID=A0A1S4C1J7_TOBAC|nr:PREDICTED: transcriptional corepressor LEUNIG-like isoform X1 [Nicotiana tabacum]